MVFMSKGDVSGAKIRGPTYLTDIWGRPQNLPPISVEYNEFGQPIGGEYNIVSLPFF